MLGERSIVYWLPREIAMQTLQIHDVPDKLYNRLAALAQSEQRSLSDQVIYLLAKTLEVAAQPHDQAQILADIRRQRFTPPPTAPDSVEMVREDRNR
jgi:hypothetical protein